MKYIVSHHANFEPSGYQSYPDKEFTDEADARAFFAEKRTECKAKAITEMNRYPNLSSTDFMRKDLFSDASETELEKRTWWGELAAFTFRDNYTYHTWTLSFEWD